MRQISHDTGTHVFVVLRIVTSRLQKAAGRSADSAGRRTQRSYSWYTGAAGVESGRHGT